MGSIKPFYFFFLLLSMHMPAGLFTNLFNLLLTAVILFFFIAVFLIALLLIQLGKKRKNEEKLRKINRELQAISECNRAMIRADCESGLLEDICRIICEIGGYRMAWVGYAENDANKTVRPVSWGGFEDGYLKDIDITWADNERGRGPTGTAIRTGKSCYIQNYRTSANVSVWRDEALRRGYRSGIALPLLDKNKEAFGALSIYGFKDGAFSPEEIRMLEELAGNLAFGIIVFRMMKESERMEEKLTDAFSYVQTILEKSPTGIVTCKAGGEVVSVNPALMKIAGGTKEEFEKQNFRNLESWKNSGLLSAADEVLSSGIEKKIEIHTHSTFGKEFWVSCILASFVYGGEQYLLLMMNDISERKFAEEALASEHNYIQTLMDNLPDGIYFKDVESRFILINKAQAEKFGLDDPGQVAGKTDFDFFTTEHAQSAYEDERKILKSEQPLVNKDEKETWPDGHCTWVSTIKLPFYDINGKIIGTFGVSRDITERKSAEDELNRRQQIHSAIVNQASDGIVLIDTVNLNFIEFNDAACKGLGYSREEFENMTLYDIQGVDSPDVLRKKVENVIEKGGGYFESIQRCKDGKIRDTQVSQRIISFNNDIFMAGIWHDITGLKLTEEKLRASLEEKEALLRELYHRTKNNMQVISAMLHIQLTYTPDERILGVFKAMENRIQSMALVQQKLYQSKDLSSINFREYIRDLAGLLINSYNVSYKKINLDLSGLEDVRVMIDSAIPCGLIMNELISNSLKYAFPGDKTGEIRISLRQNPQKLIEINYSDNGIGVQPGFDFRAGAKMGLKSVFSLVENQMQGEISIESRNGLIYKILFKDEYYERRV